MQCASCLVKSFLRTAGWGTLFPPNLRLLHLPRHTSKGADIVLLGGDLNMHPEDVGVRLLRGWAGLQDSFTAAEKVEVSVDKTTNCSGRKG